VFTYKGNNRALLGFFDAIVLVMETGFAVTALLAMFLNLSIASEVELDAKLLHGRATGEEIRYSISHASNAEDEAMKPVPGPKVE